MLKRIPVLVILTLLLVGLSGNALAQNRDLTQDRWPIAQTFDPPWQEGDDEDDDEGNDGLGFGKKIAGTWLGTGEFGLDLGCDGVVDCPPEPAPCFTTFEYDSQSFTVGGFYAATNPNSPLLGQGTWEKTGPREASTNNIVYVDDDRDGVIEFILRIPGVFTFDQDYRTATSTFGAVGYLPGQNPLDPDEMPLFCTLGEHFLLEKVTAP